MGRGESGAFPELEIECRSGEFCLTAFLVLAELLPWSRLCLGAHLVKLCSSKAVS